METTIQPPHPAIQRYLEDLEKSVQQTPSVASGPALADAQEFLLSEWESVRRRQPECSEEVLYRHLVRKFGMPAEVASGYADSIESANFESSPVHPAPRRPRRIAGKITASLFLLAVAVIGALLSRNFALRVTAVNAAQGAAQAVPGAAIQFNLETMACAGRVVSSCRGLPERSPSANPQAALGMPNCRDSSKQANAFFNLGRGGELIVEFTEHRLCDGPGADLAIFEIGFGESVDVAVSQDGQAWSPLGRTRGGLATLDLAVHGLQGREYRYVRLIDAEVQVTEKSAYWGADIDAVVAIHTTRTPK